jgi:hypothetical protein
MSVQTIESHKHKEKPMLSADIPKDSLSVQRKICTCVPMADANVNPVGSVKCGGEGKRMTPVLYD